MEGHVEQDVDSLASLVGSLSTEESGRIVEQIDGGERRWKSVLPLLDAASDEMALGDLVAGKTFDLHDAMSAIEIMDKQMDSGMEKERPADEPTAPPPSPGEDASPRLVIAVLDEVMCAEQGWYNGLSLAQTLWRLEWLQNADEVRSMPLRSALIATARAVAATPRDRDARRRARRGRLCEFAERAQPAQRRERPGAHRHAQRNRGGVRRGR